MNQKILILTTSYPSLRSDVDSWTGEDGNVIDLSKPIGLSPCLSNAVYQTPLHAIADGWRLLVPPVKYTRGVDLPWYEWWLEK